jgi:hypothetical protein
MPVYAADSLDPIDSLAARLSNDHLWQNGLYPLIELPEVATNWEVIEAALKARRITNFKILGTKKVKVRGSLPDDYFATLIVVNFEKKIILYQYHSSNGWWTRIYDSK